MRRTIQRSLATLAVLTLGLVVGCEQILQLPDRDLGDNVAVCRDGVCSCVADLGDCNGKPEDGCEAALSGQDAGKNCGACGHDCLGGGCGTKGCGVTSIPFDVRDHEYVGPVVWEGDAFVVDVTTREVLVLRAGGSTLDRIGSFEGAPVAFKSNEQGAYLLTVPPQDLTPEGLPPYHASIFRVALDGPKIEASIVLGELLYRDFAFTSSGWYFAVYDPAEGFVDLHRYDRETGAHELATLDCDWIVDARADTAYWSYQSDLVEHPEGGPETVVFDAEINQFDYYVTNGAHIYGYDSFVPETDGTRFSRIERSSGAIETIEADVTGLDADPDGACWLDSTNGKVWVWTVGQSTPTEVADEMHFGLEQFFCAHDATARYWLDLSGIHRQVKPLPPASP